MHRRAERPQEEAVIKGACVNPNVPADRLEKVDQPIILVLSIDRCLKLNKRVRYFCGIGKDDHYLIKSLKKTRAVLKDRFIRNSRALARDFSKGVDFRSLNLKRLTFSFKSTRQRQPLIL